MTQIDRDNFLNRYGYTVEQFLQTGLDWSMLEQIFERHRGMLKELQTAATYVSERLQDVPAVHSLKVRVKDPEHLVEKIIRKKIQHPDTAIDCTTYEERITDLAGVRILHLFKDEWQPINEFVRATWKLHEPPIAYVREGDPEELQRGFTDADCRVELHPLGYRSIHYLIEFQPTKRARLVELQVRTIFEEGWSEIDHKVRYPRQTAGDLNVFLAIFNRLAGSADEMGSFTKTLDARCRQEALSREESTRQLQEREVELQQTISRLEISEVERQGLQKQLAELKAVQPTKSLFSQITDSESMVNIGELMKPLGRNITVSSSGINELMKSMGNVTITLGEHNSILKSMGNLTFPTVDVPTFSVTAPSTKSGQTATCSVCGKALSQSAGTVPSTVCPDCNS